MGLFINTGPGNHDQLLFRQLSQKKIKFGYCRYWPKFESGTYSLDGKNFIRGRSALFDSFNYIAYSIWSKIPVVNRKNYHLYYIFSLFDKISSKYIKDEKVLLGWSQMSLYSMQKMKQLGGYCMLEHPMPHAKAWMDLVEYEYQNYGKGIKYYYSLFTDSMVNRMLKEYEISDQINVLSTFSKKTFIDYGVPENKIRVIPLGIDSDFFKPEKKFASSKKFKVLFVGRMELWKGVHYLLKAFSELNLPDAELWLVGRLLPEMEPYFKKYSGKFIFFGPKNPEELVEIYNHVDLFVLPSVQEAFGLVILEAMSSGIPVIATDNSAGPDVIEEGKEGFNIPIRNIEILKEKILWFYTHRPIGREMGMQARDKVMSNYTLDHYGSRMVDILKKFVKTSTD